jgi:glycosyltransferase involved in cell wall biosynthesis
VDLITFIVPVRRPHAVFFQRAIASLMAQTDPNWRAIVVTENDDPSMQEWVPPDRRIRVSTNDGKLLSGAVNTGIKKAHTPFVAELLGDDALDRHAVAVLMKHVFAMPDADFFHSSMQYIDAHDNEIMDVRESRPVTKAADLMAHTVTHLMCFRASKALAVGGVDPNLGLHGADDYDFPWVMWEHGAIFRHIPDPLYRYRVHNVHERLTTHVPRAVQEGELKKIWAKHGIPADRFEAELASRVNGYLDQALS